MKIMHCSDIHLGRRPVGGIGEFSNKRYNDYFSAFASAIQTAINEKVDVFLITGDLFDRKELIPEVLSKTEELLQKLVENNIKTILVEGNHDNITNGKEADSWLIYLENKNFLDRPTYTVEDEKYNFYPIVIEDINFYGIGYPGFMVNETLSALSEHLKIKKEKNNIVLVHTAISSSDFLPGTVDKETIDKFKDLVLYIGGGHFHSYQYYPKENPYFFIPGSLEYWDIAEQGKKGSIIFDTENCTHKFVPSNPRNKQVHKIKINSNNYKDFQDEYISIIEKLNINKSEDIIVLELILKETFYIDSNWCETLILEKGALKAAINIKYPGQKELSNEIDETIQIEEIERDIINNWEIFSGKKEEITKFLDKLKLFQKENNQDQFIENFDSMLNMLIADGEEQNENK